MYLSALIPGRVSTTLIAQRLAETILSGQSDLNRLQDQISSGKLFSLPSDSPTAATQTLALQKIDERTATFQQNIQTNQGYLNATDQGLSTIGDALAQARGLLQTGLGDQVSDSERQSLAQQVQSLLTSAIGAGNTKSNGRYLFAGSQTGQPPFSQDALGVHYAGDAESIQTFADFGLLVNAGVDGAKGLRAVTKPITGDLNPAVTLNTKFDQLNRGQGVAPGSIQVTLVNGTTTVSKTVDLSNAETLGDVKTRIEAAFAGGPITMTVDVDPTTNSGLRFTPSAGTVQVADVEQGRTAFDLGLRSGPVAVLHGSDVDPTLSLDTAVASLNGNTGIGATAGTGLRIVNGTRVSTVDLNGANTVADVLDRIRAADPDVTAQISENGTGIAVSSRLSGVDFSIGENGGSNATLLGLRTFTAATKLADLNHGAGVPVDGGAKLQITRRDGTNIQVDLTGAKSVQDVLDKINAIDPGHLTAGLNTVGNGISLTDDSGAGPLVVSQNEISQGLGIDGTENSGAAGVLAGRDVNPQSTLGTFDLLSRLATALQKNDFATLNALAAPLDAEIARINLVRGDVGNRLQLLNSVNSQLSDQHVNVQGQISKLSDTDLATAITEFTQQQQALQATMQIASRTLQMSILQYL